MDACLGERQLALSHLNREWITCQFVTIDLECWRRGVSSLITQLRRGCDGDNHGHLIEGVFIRSGWPQECLIGNLDRL